MIQLERVIDIAAKIVEAVGVLVIIIAVFYAIFRFFQQGKAHKEFAYKKLRLEIGKGILLGLEILVAADIIATVVTQPSLEKVYTLGLIVVIRTFLSFALEVELEGKLPWKKG